MVLGPFPVGTRKVERSGAIHLESMRRNENMVREHLSFSFAEHARVLRVGHVILLRICSFALAQGTSHHTFRPDFDLRILHSICRFDVTANQSAEELGANNFLRCHEGVHDWPSVP